MGEKGENNPENVKRVKTRLKELGYPLDCSDNNCNQDTITAIKLFQVFNCKLKQNYYHFDGKIDKGGDSEKILFSESVAKYQDIKAGKIKPWQKDPKSSKEDADKGDDQKLKEIWAKIGNIWNVVSPYLPEGAELSSGYRSTESQRVQLHKKYKDFRKEIVSKYGIDVYDKSLKKMIEDSSEEQIKNTDKELHDQIKGINKSKEVALPGNSLHEKGRAIDIGGSATRIDNIRALGYYMLKINNQHVCAINNESNCIHFEFI